MIVKCFAFDCFGTVFDMQGVSKQEIKDYVHHVNQADFTPFAFPNSWFNLKAHPDSREGIQQLRAKGYTCVTLSNGTYDLIKAISDNNGIIWDYIIDPGYYRVYKPNIAAYKLVGAVTNYKPEECVMVTANPTFGDVEGSLAIGMRPMVIRNGFPNNIVELASFFLPV